LGDRFGRPSGVTLGFSDSNKLMYSDAFGNLQEFGGDTLNPSGWDRITLLLDFGADTYDLTLEPMTGLSANASNTWTPYNSYAVATGVPFTNALSSMQNLYFETFTDPENGLGWHKTFLDNFDGAVIPEPSTAIGLLAGGLVAALRRRGR
jgi:hypothetical protein